MIVLVADVETKFPYNIKFVLHVMLQILYTHNDTL